jgi:RNA polymerase sigma-70 factor (ECF subfamily)
MQLPATAAQDEAPGEEPRAAEARRFRDPDIDLMLRFKGGDEAAFEELVRKHTRSVLNIVERYLADRSQAEDVAQDVFVKVYKARVKYEPAAKFTTWLFRITVNHCLNELRSRRSQPVGQAPMEELVEHPSPENPDDRMNSAELKSAVREALDSLPENQRMAVILSRYQELSYDEIAETMNLSLEAVKSLLFRAKENLKERLKRFAT